MNHLTGALIGPILRRARKEKRLTLRGLAARADVSPSLLSQIENSKANPSVATLYSIAAALTIPPSHFFQDHLEPDGDLAAEETRFPPRLMKKALGNIVASPAETQETSPLRLPIVRRAERASIELLGGVTWFRLTARDEANVEFLEIVYDVGATSGEKLSRHSGREYGLLLEGQLLVELGFERYFLSPGDSIAFESSTPHRLANNGNVPARAVWVVVSK